MSEPLSKLQKDIQNLKDNIDESPFLEAPEGRHIPIYGKYLVYDYGGFYSRYKSDFCKPSLVKSHFGGRNMVKMNGNNGFHRDFLVAVLFVENDDPVNKTEIWHKDLDFRNDHYENLEWITKEEFIRLRKEHTSVKKELKLSALPEGTFKRMKDNLMNYLIYNDGYFYSLYYERMLKKYIASGRHVITLAGKLISVDTTVATYFLHNDDPENKTQVWHKDGNRLNDHYTNLLWCTPQEYMEFETNRVIQAFLEDKPTLEYKDFPDSPNYVVFSDCHILSKYTRDFVYVPTKEKIDKYCRIGLTKDGVAKTYRVHRIIAATWIPNHENMDEYNIIDHINRMKGDNAKENLRWCNRSENAKNQSFENARRRVVLQFDLEKNLIHRYTSRKEAIEKAKLIDHGSFHGKYLISRVDNKEYYWEYENYQEPFERPDGFFDIPGFSFDSISEQGEIYSERLKGFRSSTENDEGYMKIALTDEYGYNTHFSVHELVMMVFEGPRPVGYEVNHKNGTKNDNRYENLEYSLPTENSQHKCRVLGKGVRKVTCYDKLLDTETDYYCIEEAERKLKTSGTTIKKYIKGECGNNWFRDRYQFFVHPRG